MIKRISEPGITSNNPAYHKFQNLKANKDPGKKSLTYLRIQVEGDRLFTKSTLKRLL